MLVQLAPSHSHAYLHEDAERHVPAAARLENPLLDLQVTRDQRKEVAGLGVGVHPHSKVAVPGQLPGGLEVAVGEQDGVVGLGGLHAGGVPVKTCVGG